MALEAFLRRTGVWVLHAQAVTNAESARRVEDRLAVVDEQRALRIESGVLLHRLPQTLIFFRITKCVGGKQ